jgi:hypothetical protein
MPAAVQMRHRRLARRCSAGSGGAVSLACLRTSAVNRQLLGSCLPLAIMGRSMDGVWTACQGSPDNSACMPIPSSSYQLHNLIHASLFMHPCCVLLPQGTDVKLSGHFVYASVSDMTDAPSLRCTNR